MNRGSGWRKGVVNQRLELVYDILLSRKVPESDARSMAWSLVPSLALGLISLEKDRKPGHGVCIIMGLNFSVSRITQRPVVVRTQW